MVIIKTNNEKIHVRSRIFFNSNYVQVIPDEGDMIEILYDDIKYIDSNAYQNIEKED
jgi:hypothetical protein